MLNHHEKYIATESTVFYHFKNINFFTQEKGAAINYVCKIVIFEHIE